jgi:hypothetical protein
MPKWFIFPRNSAVFGWFGQPPSKLAVEGSSPFARYVGKTHWPTERFSGLPTEHLDHVRNPLFMIGHQRVPIRPAQPFLSALKLAASSYTAN